MTTMDQDERIHNLPKQRQNINTLQAKKYQIVPIPR